MWLLLCLWTWGIFFGEFQCLHVDDCPTASCDSGVLARGSESTSFYSAILVPNLIAYMFITPQNECSALLNSLSKVYNLLFLSFSQTDPILIIQVLDYFSLP